MSINVWFSACIALSIKQYYSKYGESAPQANLRCETAISCHVDEDLYSFEPSNKLIAGDFIIDLKDDLSSAV